MPMHDERRRREIRGALRHPLENLTLIAAIVASVLVMGFSLYYVIDAFRHDETPGTYPLLFTLAPVLLWLARGHLMAKMRLGAVKVTPTQYPEAFAMVQEAATAFGMRRAPDASTRPSRFACASKWSFASVMGSSVSEAPYTRSVDSEPS